MRCGIWILVLTGMMAAGTASSQGLPQAGPRDRTIERHWPDDGAQSPRTTRVNWEGRDAVGLQFWDREAPPGNVVPVSVLKIPGDALKEMHKSDKALKAGDVKGSAEHLERMLELMPSFAIGHNSLGTRYVALHQYDKAMEEFEKAVTLEPGYRLAVDNMVVTLCTQHRYAEAEPIARRALQIQPDAASSKYLLGSILVSEDKPTQEAYQLLQSVQDKYPRARMFLAKTFEMRGENEKAEDELREYLRSPAASDNGVAQDWLTRLEKESSVERSAGTRARVVAGSSFVPF